MGFKRLTIGSFTAELPIIQGGMGVGISLSGLASAVANEGGIGVIAAAMIGMDESDLSGNFLEANTRALRKEIRKARELTQGILGVNVMVALSNFSDLVKTAVDEGIDIIFSGAGLPLNLPQFVERSSKTCLVPIVSSARATGIIFKRWAEKYNRIPDAVVVEGPMAGGHLGFKKEMLGDPAYSLERLVPQVLDAVRPYEETYNRPIPVIAAGGVYTGADIHRFLKLGASGVQMATRFVTTHECDTSEEFKQAYVNAKREDIEIISSPVGMPGRAIRNAFLEEVAHGKKKPFKCPYRCIITCDYTKSPYCIAFALLNAKRGRLSHGFAFAGANAYRAEKIISVQEVVQQLKEEYESATKA